MLLSRFACAAVLAAGATLSMVGAASADGDRDCKDFSNQAEAQRFFESASGDRHRLDADNDGIACEHLPAPSHVPTPNHTHVHEPPVGWIDTGDGSTIDGSTTDDPGALPLLLGLAGLGAASATAVVVTRRARRNS